MSNPPPPPPRLRLAAAEGSPGAAAPPPRRPPPIPELPLPEARDRGRGECWSRETGLPVFRSPAPCD